MALPAIVPAAANAAAAPNARRIIAPVVVVRPAPAPAPVKRVSAPPVRLLYGHKLA